MNYFHRHGLSPTGFSAILSSPAIADWWWIDRTLALGQTQAARGPASPSPLPHATQARVLWPPLYLAVAQASGRGESVVGAAWAQRLQALAQDSPAALLLVATPALLLQVNRYGHRQRDIQHWAGDLGLSSVQITALGDYFLCLCEALTGPGRRLPDSASLTDWPEPLVQPQSSLEPLLALVQSVQGQFWLALELALALGYAGETISLVGLLASLVVGPPGLPGAMRHGQVSPSAQVAERWNSGNAERLDDLAKALYRRWAGVGDAAVTIPGTAYNS